MKFKAVASFMAKKLPSATKQLATVRDIEVEPLADCGAGWHPAADWQSAPG
jgi:hypothetical protein